MQRSATARRRRLDQLRAAVLASGLTDDERDTRVVLYLTVRARMPWHVIAWHDVWHVVSGARPADVHEAAVWQHHMNRLGLDPAHRRVISWRKVRA